MKRIECTVLNDPARQAWMLVFGLLILFVVLITFGTDGFHMSIFAVFIVAILFYAASRAFMRMKITLEYVDNEPQIIVKGILSKRVFRNPQFDAVIKTCPITRFSHHTYFKLVLEDGHNSISFFDPIEFVGSTQDIEIEPHMNSLFYMGIRRTIGESQGKVWEIYKEL